MRKQRYGASRRLKIYFFTIVCCCILICCSYVMLPLIKTIFVKTDLSTQFPLIQIRNLQLNFDIFTKTMLWKQLERNYDTKRSSNITINPYQYNWIILEEKFCTTLHPNLRIIIVIHSAADHFEQRSFLRRMYGKQFYKQYGITTLFAVGMPSDDATQIRLLNESRNEHDLIQQNFRDSYRNLTWKALMWLRFIDEHCSTVQYIIKIDDDVVGNIFQLLHYLNVRINAVSLLESQRQIFCRVIYNRPVDRRKNSKWYVASDELSNKYYLNYCVGMAIVFTGDLPNILLRAAQNERYFWIDDYFITGILTKKVNAHLVDLKQQVVVYAYEGSEQALLDGKIFFHLISNMSHGLHLWEQIQRHYSIPLINNSLQSMINPSNNFIHVF